MTIADIKRNQSERLGVLVGANMGITLIRNAVGTIPEERREDALREAIRGLMIGSHATRPPFASRGLL